MTVLNRHRWIVTSSRLLTWAMTSMLTSPTCPSIFAVVRNPDIYWMTNMVTFLYSIPNYRFTVIWSNIYTNIYTLMMKRFKNNTNSYSQHCTNSYSQHCLSTMQQQANKKCSHLGGMRFLRQALLQYCLFTNSHLHCSTALPKNHKKETFNQMVIQIT
jgi:hypothetical protein